MDKNAKQTLIDHELLTAPTSGGGGLKRVAAFGWYAGAVGAGEALCLTGLALLKRGIATPLLVCTSHTVADIESDLPGQHLPRPYTFTSLDAYKDGLRQVGDTIRAQQPGQTGAPLVIGVTGSVQIHSRCWPPLRINETDWRCSSGNVGSGAKDMLDAMGVEWVTPDQLPGLEGSAQVSFQRTCPGSGMMGD